MTEQLSAQAITENLGDEILDICSHYATKRSAIMPALHLVQEKYDMVNETSYKAIAEILEIPEIWVSEVASFYTMYNRSEVGKHHLQLCTNVPCMLRGAYALKDHMQQKLGLEKGETTEDGLFTLTFVECIGSCDVAPAMMINQDYHENLSIESLDEIIDQLSKVEAS